MTRLAMLAVWRGERPGCATGRGHQRETGAGIHLDGDRVDVRERFRHVLTEAGRATLAAAEAIEGADRGEGPHVAHDVECRGTTVPEGSVMLLLNGSANRDERRYPDGEKFDIHRGDTHLSFGHGLHFCLGSALARMQARVALEEVIKRWPDWEVDYANASKAHTSSVRGWSKLPVFTG